MHVSQGRHENNSTEKMSFLSHEGHGKGQTHCCIWRMDFTSCGKSKKAMPNGISVWKSRGHNSLILHLTKPESHCLCVWTMDPFHLPPGVHTLILQIPLKVHIIWWPWGATALNLKCQASWGGPLFLGLSLMVKFERIWEQKWKTSAPYFGQIEWVGYNLQTPFDIGSWDTSFSFGGWGPFRVYLAQQKRGSRIKVIPPAPTLSSLFQQTNHQSFGSKWVAIPKMREKSSELLALKCQRRVVINSSHARSSCMPCSA